MGKTTAPIPEEISDKVREDLMEAHSKQGYDALHSYKGWILMIQEDEEPGENRKYMYRVMDPQGLSQPYDGKTYQKEKFRDFITKIDKIT